MVTDKKLLSEIEAMAPWHHDVHIRGDIWTVASKKSDDTGEIVQHYPATEAFRRATKRVLPDGMTGRSFLDCACNCGGYSFAAKELGAGRVFGFDIRKHWIDQANFIVRNRDADSSGMRFEVADLMDLGTMDEQFDVTWFSGIFYHLPDPVTGLKLAADHTKELLFLNTACMSFDEDAPEVPMLKYKQEGTEQLMSGVYGPSWLPSGPRVLTHILNWLGFCEVKVYLWVENPNARIGPPGQGRIAVVAAREAGRLDDVKGLSRPVEPRSRNKGRPDAGT